MNFCFSHLHKIPGQHPYTSSSLVIRLSTFSSLSAILLAPDAPSWGTRASQARGLWQQLGIPLSMSHAAFWPQFQLLLPPRPPPPPSPPSSGGHTHSKAPTIKKERSGASTNQAMSDPAALNILVYIFWYTNIHNSVHSIYNTVDVELFNQRNMLIYTLYMNEGDYLSLSIVTST